MASFQIQVHRVSRAAEDSESPVEGDSRVAVILSGFCPAVESLRELDGGLTPNVPAPDLFKEAFRTEVLFLEEPRVGNELKFGVTCISPFEDGEGKALGAILSISPAPDATSPQARDYELALEVCRKNLKLHVKEGEDAHLPPKRIVETLKREAAIEGLKSPETRRISLVALSEYYGAAMVGDVALSGSPEVVAALTETFLALPMEQKTSDTAGWLLTSAFLESLLRQLKGRRLSPDLVAIAARHMGEAGLRVSFLEEAPTTCDSMEEFRARLARQNTLYLQDLVEVSRRRAFAWLQARELAPEGYDPQASYAERRAALARAKERVQKESSTPNE